jgi:hypothetical protein
MTGMVASSLVVGTRNRKKGGELVELLAPWGIAAVTLADVPDALEIAESGATFAANAALKATVQAKHLRRWVLADDSGLEVDALGGAPGVYSARFAQLSGGTPRVCDGRGGSVATPFAEPQGVPPKRMPTNNRPSVCQGSPPPLRPSRTVWKSSTA